MYKKGKVIYMVSESVVKAMMEISALSFVVPFAFVIIWKMRYRKSIVPSLTGALVFLTFGIILKSVPNLLFLSVDSPVSRFLKENIWAYAIYGGLSAGIFEEMGRYVAFKLFLSRHDYRESSVAYGLGHGGIECMAVLGFAMLQNFTYAQLINAGKMEEVISTFPDESAKAVFRDLQEAIINMTVQDCIWAGVERLSALALQVSLSVLVYQAARIQNKKHFLAIAILLHSLIDVFAVFGQQGIMSVAATEIVILVYALIVSVFAYKIYANLPHDKGKSTESRNNWAFASKKLEKGNSMDNGSTGENNGK